jgi:RecB family exonuclease
VKIVSIMGIAGWADAVIALDARGPLPTRIALVPSEAHAHALRVELVSRGPYALAGTRFLTAAGLARAVLDAAQVGYRLGEETRRPLRVRELLRAQPGLTTAWGDALGSAGWEVAFASTIEQLEAAALRPDDLERLDDQRATDLARIWRGVDAAAGASWTVPRLLTEAQRVLKSDQRGEPGAGQGASERGQRGFDRPGRGGGPFDGPVLAAVTAGIDAAHAQLLRVVPQLVLGVVASRPVRPRAVERMRQWFGDAAAEVASGVAGGASSACAADAPELAVLAAQLFAAPELVAAPGRRRSRGADGTVALELHAGVDDELEAAARWVADEVFHHGTALQDLAILVPAAEPLATLVAARVEALAWPPGVRPVYLAGGRPAVATSAGARLLAVIRALEAYLPAEAVVAVLPRLRLAGSEGHLSPGRTRAWLARLGTIGGSAARPADALRWRDRLAVVELDPAGRAVAPAVEALVAIAAQQLAGASLGELWRAIRTFAVTHLIAPRALAAILEQLDSEVGALADDPVTERVVGGEAIALIAATLGALRLEVGRYGEPAIYVGTVTGAAGLGFVAARVLGLAESAFPMTLRADAVLPAELRRRLAPHALLSDADFATAQLQAFDHIVVGVTRRLCVSAPRTDLDGSERAPAALFVEIAAALGRPNPATGAPGRAIPTIAELERDGFGVARAATLSRQAAAPLVPGAWLDRVARGARPLPRGWSRAAVTSPGAVLERAATMSGVLGPQPLTARVPGVAADHPVSASALRVLLTCPQRFLLERVLGYWVRSGPIVTHRIDPAAYGALVHQVIDDFAVAHGAAFGARHAELAHWLAVADQLAVTGFDGLAANTPLLGASVLAGERRRLRRDVATFVGDDWSAGRPRRFVAAERGFGEAAGVALAARGGPLFVTGRIDRLDVEAELTIVRDLKTGRARPRARDDRDPDVGLDLQLAVYAAVAEHLAAEWRIPAQIAAAYVYVDHLAIERERGFRDDRAALRAAGQGWLDVAAAVLRDHAYVQSPDPRDCGICPFAPVCGDDSADTAVRLRDATGTLAAFRELKA